MGQSFGSVDRPTVDLLTTAIGLIREQQGRFSDDDPDGAIAWYKRAVEVRSPKAMNNLGVLRRQAGQIDGPDGAEHWYRKAAERGNPTAMFNLGLLLHRQKRTRHPDGDCALYWLRKAEETGCARAVAALADLDAGWLGRRRLRRSRYQVE